MSYQEAIFLCVFVKDMVQPDFY